MTVEVKTIKGNVICSGPTLRDAVSSNTVLINANLEESMLCGVGMERKNFCHASFKRANLTGSTFNYSSLFEADLEGAILVDCQFRHTNLIDVKLEGAHLNWDSHPLIAEILRQAAGDDIEKRKIAGLVSVSHDWCWPQFLADDDPLADWAMGVLSKYVHAWDDFPRCMQKWMEENK